MEILILSKEIFMKSKTDEKTDEKADDQKDDGQPDTTDMPDLENEESLPREEINHQKD